MEIKGSKTPGTYSASIWSHSFSILLCEEPKPNISIVSGCLDPWEPLVMDLNIQSYSKQPKGIYKLFLHFNFENLDLGNPRF